MNHNQYIHNHQVHQDVLAVLRTHCSVNWVLEGSVLREQLGVKRYRAANGAILAASGEMLARWKAEAAAIEPAKTEWFNACEVDPARSGVYEVRIEGWYAFYFYSLRKWGEIRRTAQHAADSAVIPAIKSDRSQITRWRGLAERPAKEELKNFITGNDLSAREEYKTIDRSEKAAAAEEAARRYAYGIPGAGKSSGWIAAQATKSEPNEFTDTQRLNFLLSHTHHVIHGTDKAHLFVYEPGFEPVARARIDNAMRWAKKNDRR